ncbi:MAG: acyl carrier protein [Myxococcales bacterium]|nr:acyl carrier protein [Myxococcales bacterium]
MSDDTRTQVREFILMNFLDGGDDSQLKDDVSLERAHIVDSARALEMILFIEDTFGFEVDNEDATPENFDSVNAIVAYVERKKG